MPYISVMNYYLLKVGGRFLGTLYLISLFLQYILDDTIYNDGDGKE
jgi:hypothetical protein